MKTNLFITFFLLVLSIQLQSQSTLAIGEWKSHLAYKEGLSVTQSEDKVIYASSRGMFSIAKEDLSVSFLSTENGLSGSAIKKVAYDESEKLLFVIYQDNNVDLIRGDDIINVPSIKDNSSIIGSKSINDIYFDGKGFAYLGTDFGLLIHNNKKIEFSSTTFTENIKILSLAYAQNRLYAGTNTGLFLIPLDGSINIADISSWKRINIDGLNPSTPIIDVATKYNKIFVSTQSTVYSSELSDNDFMPFITVQDNEKITFLSDQGSELMIGIEDDRPISKVLYVSANSEVRSEGAECINRATFAIEDQKGRIWYADQWDPVRYSESKSSGCRKLSFSGPFANSAGEIAFKRDTAYIASLGITEDYQYANTRRGMYTYSENNWTNFNQDNVPGIRDFEILNVQGVAIHPKSNEIFLGSYWNGVIQFNPQTKVSKHWNKDNSTLQGVIGDENRTRIPFMVFDKNQNLWVSNFGAPRPLAVKTPQDKWISFNVPGEKFLGDIAIDSSGNKWVAVVGTGNGLLVYNEGASLDNTSDDKSRYINRVNSEITGNKINCVAVDLEGAVWVGTDAGPVVFDCGNPFDNACRGNIRKVVVDNIPAPLLKTEDILCIEIDGANRKWFGTRNGIFVQSPDGASEIAQYNTSNSPILDNKVTNLRYNPNTGEMFVITQSGIQSLKTETLRGGKNHSSDVYAFPNPVRPGYSGMIAIKGLVRDANVKITDINGKLVHETTSLGGQAVWDGRDYNGIPASAGVYLVFSADTDITGDLDSFVTKILIVR
jgi:hypothetical protein